MEQRNMVLAIVVSVLIVLGYQFGFEQPRIEKERARQQAAEEMAAKTQGGQASSQTGLQAPPTNTVPPVAGAPEIAGAPSVSGAPGIPSPQTGAPPVPGTGQVLSNPGPDRAKAIGRSPRINVKTPRLRGSIAVRGGRIDDLILTDYRETLDEGSPPITLLSPTGGPSPYYAAFGWVPADKGTKVPGDDTLWTAESTTLTPARPVTLSWDNGAGLIFKRTIAVDQNYMFTVTDRVVNAGGQPVTLYPFALISRTGIPEMFDFFILHEGMVGVTNGQLREYDYDDLIDDGPVKDQTTGGWVGITDKYWLAALIPDQKTPVATRFSHAKRNESDVFQVDYLGGARTVAAGSTVETAVQVFAGAKVVKLLNMYEQEQGVILFDRAIDWGYLRFLTQPIFMVLEWLFEQIGNFGVSILLLTVGIKVVFFPLANKSYRSMSRMKKLQPKMMKLREQYGSDKARMNQELMALYKKENANPMSGCLPILVQIPVFFALYKVLFVTIEMRHTPFFGWIQDLSAPDPLTILTGFGLFAWDVPEILDVVNIGIWPLLMGGTMYLQQKLNPQPPDPTQAKIFMLMPIIFTFLLARFPAGLVIYWAWNNLLSVIQQWVIMKKAGVDPLK